MEGKPTNDQNLRGNTGTQAGTNVAGTVPNWDEVSKRDALPILGQSPELGIFPGLGEKAIDAKVIRFIHSQYGIGINEMQSLGILAAYIYLQSRENIGVSITAMLDWSGARSRWQRRVRQGIEECIKLGAVEVIPANNGSTIDITHKGRQVLNAYDRRFEEVRKDIEARRNTNLMKREATRLKKSTPRSQRQAI